jgi:putative redox protein
MQSERISFRNFNGDDLQASLDLPDGEAAHYALFAHCFTCNRNFKAFRNISRALAERGIGVLRFDFTGLGESGGDFSDTNLSSNAEDLQAAAGFLEENHRPPGLLIGHSLGGAAVLQAASTVTSSKAVAVIAAPSDPAHLNRLLGLTPEDFTENEEREIQVAGRKFAIKKHFVEDLEKIRMKETLENLGRALLLLHSPADRLVPMDNATAIFQAAVHPKSFVSLGSADHLLSDERDSTYAGTVIAAWASRYLG